MSMLPVERDCLDMYSLLFCLRRLRTSRPEDTCTYIASKYVSEVPALRKMTSLYLEIMSDMKGGLRRRCKWGTESLLTLQPVDRAYQALRCGSGGSIEAVFFGVWRGGL